MFLGVHFGGKWRIEKEWFWFESIAFVKKAEMGKVNVCMYIYEEKQRPESPREKKENGPITNGPYEDEVPHKATSKFEIHDP